MPWQIQWASQCRRQLTRPMKDGGLRSTPTVKGYLRGQRSGASGLIQSYAWTRRPIKEATGSRVEDWVDSTKVKRYELHCHTRPYEAPHVSNHHVRLVALLYIPWIVSFECKIFRLQDKHGVEWEFQRNENLVLSLWSNPTVQRWNVVSTNNGSINESIKIYLSSKIVVCCTIGEPKGRHMRAAA